MTILERIDRYLDEAKDKGWVIVNKDNEVKWGPAKGKDPEMEAHNQLAKIKKRAKKEEAKGLKVVEI